MQVKIQNTARTFLACALAALLVLCLGGCAASSQTSSSNTASSAADTADSNTEQSTEATSSTPSVAEDGTYTSKDDVALYLHTYGHLPSNFITKSKARKAGWVSSEGNLDEVCPGMSIGGDHYGDYDNQLPDKKGRSWKECDINYTGGHRSGERIIFSNDGLIYYTNNHYKSFTQLY